MSAEDRKFSTNRDILPDQNSSYGTQEYWDKRYGTEAPETAFDWFLKPEQCLPLMRDLIPSKESRILMLGCGNSALGEAMYDEGWRNIVNIDYSGTLIQNMKALHSETRPEMEWLEMDIRKLDFPDGVFDIALDKGTMDAMITEKGDVWNPSEEVQKNCNAEVDEVIRILKNTTSAKFIYLTFGQPHFRKRYLKREGWDLEVRDVGDGVGFNYFLYVLTRSTKP
ncbi:Predicted spermine/spermidine synthase [Phaffia rhodozyma]|uniref:Predicted spermine/spermidine synthase n=1 Tax=Phaffia rhodozyma TaxID=264483 RepID=A0A0F7SEW8_PHARH|nr:Predicted spermine/spermidine synthase [Phaffia rhodozyma]